MVWSADPADFPPFFRRQDIPRDSVILRYVRAPEYHVWLTEAPELVSHLQHGGKPEIEVEFSVTCNTWPMRHRFAGFSETRIGDFRGPFVNRGVAGAIGPGEREHPLAVHCGGE